MFLLNYTTKIDPIKTAGEIEYELVKHGARMVVKEYTEGGHVKSINFIVATPAGDLPIRLPINQGPVLKVLKSQKQKSYSVDASEEQAERVAWRILLDWVKAQMAILETEMVKMEQIFLPYITAPNGQTLFEALEAKNFLLGPGQGGGL